MKFIFSCLLFQTLIQIHKHKGNFVSIFFSTPKMRVFLIKSNIYLKNLNSKNWKELEDGENGQMSPGKFRGKSLTRNSKPGFD